MDKKLYTYSGPVVVFNTCVVSNWYGKTYAVSPGKAKSNLTYQCKKQLNLVAGSKVTLLGDIVEV